MPKTASSPHRDRGVYPRATRANGVCCDRFPERAEAGLGRGVAGGRAAAVLGGPGARLARAEPVLARYETPVERDPFAVPLAEKEALLLAAAEAIGPGLHGAEASYDCFRETKLFASSEGACVEQVLTETGAGLLATALSADDLQRRSYPQSVPRSIKGQRGDLHGGLGTSQGCGGRKAPSRR